MKEDPQIIRQFIQAGVCPWCGKGPFTVLAGHTQRIHQIDRHELRELALLVKKASICAPQHSETLRERMKIRGVRMERFTGKRTFSTAGRMAQRDRVEAHRARDPEGFIAQRVAAARALTPEQREIRNRKSAANTRARAAAQTHCKQGHARTPENTYWSKGLRHCKPCQNAANHRSYLKRRNRIRGLVPA